MLKVLRTDERAQLPTYATDGAACFDLHALLPEGLDLVIIEPGEALTINTGLKFEIPHGYVMQVFSRSGHGFKHGVRLANCTGIIDSDYRGEVMVRLCNDCTWSADFFEVRHGDKIAQAMLVLLPKFDIIEVNELSDTERGAGGFGSTGR